MGKSLSADLRLRMIEGVLSGKSCRAVATQFAVAPSTVIRLVRHHKDTGGIEPAKQGRPHGYGWLSQHRGFLIACVRETPDITMPELAALLETQRGVKAHPASLSKVLCAAGFSYKKNAAGSRARTQ